MKIHSANKTVINGNKITFYFIIEQEKITINKFKFKGKIYYGTFESLGKHYTFDDAINFINDNKSDIYNRILRQHKLSKNMHNMNIFEQIEMITKSLGLDNSKNKNVVVYKYNKLDMVTLQIERGSFSKDIYLVFEDITYKNLLFTSTSYEVVEDYIIEQTHNYSVINVDEQERDYILNKQHKKIEFDFMWLQ